VSAAAGELERRAEIGDTVALALYEELFDAAEILRGIGGDRTAYLVGEAWLDAACHLSHEEHSEEIRERGDDLFRAVVGASK
jgi:hypothetical protein